MTAYIVRGVPQSILKDSWWLADSPTDMDDSDNPPKSQVFWKNQNSIPNTSRPKQ